MLRQGMINYRIGPLRVELDKPADAVLRGAAGDNCPPNLGLDPQIYHIDAKKQRSVAFKQWYFTPHDTQ